MKTTHNPQPTTDLARSSTWKSWATGLAGLTGSLACSVTMILALLGVAGATTVAGTHAGGGMSSMASSSTESGRGPAASAHASGIMGFLLRFGPEILVISLLLVALAIGMRRRIAGVVALAAGALLYWAMYAQSSAARMYVAVVLAYSAWLLDYLWARRHVRLTAAGHFASSSR